MFAIYNTTSGAIDYVSNRPHHGAGQASVDCNSDVSFQTHYVDTSQNPPAVTARPSKPTLPTTGVAIYNLPWSLFAAGSSVTVTPEFGQAVTVTDTNEPLEFSAGTYTIAVDQPFPHHQLRWTLTVSEA